MALFSLPTLLVVYVAFLLFIFAWRRGNTRGLLLPPGPPPLPIIGNILQVKLWDLPTSLSRDFHSAMAGGGSKCTSSLSRRCGTLGWGRGAWRSASRRKPSTWCGPSHRQRPVDPAFILVCAPCNIICSILFNEHFDYHDEEFLKLIRLLNENLSILSSFWVQLYSLWPSFIHYLPGRHQKVFKNIQNIMDFILERVAQHQRTPKPVQPRDYTDCFIERMEEEKHDSYSEFNSENLAAVSLNLFSAGTETVSRTLWLALLTLLKHPEVESRVHEEIDRVVGRDRVPCMKDRAQMPYTDAVVHEVQRCINLVPSNLPHVVIQETKFRQFFLPKGTTVFPLLSSVLYDSKEFANPQRFDPNHFLDKNGNFRKSDFFIPFSIGKWACLGEGLARMEIFLFLTTTLQNFTLKPVVDQRELSTDPVYNGLLRIIPASKLCFLPRPK
ncbi:cytochrome P450 2C42-like isoform X1 [Ailuropoda melanoleuca]|uniref:cytochrome P450 2C42-like isoform X1 n=1 Tax=Ailuropoda melanoleuca TaxID=9646 RepID=UPI001494BBE6|nr:cytochrome P450 2C42-like isoform X1 [Ailuropoda melanoleuca]